MDVPETPPTAQDADWMARICAFHTHSKWVHHWWGLGKPEIKHSYDPGFEDCSDLLSLTPKAWKDRWMNIETKWFYDEYMRQMKAAR